MKHNTNTTNNTNTGTDTALFDCHATSGLYGYAIDYSDRWNARYAVTLGYSRLMFIHSGRITQGLPGGMWDEFAACEGAD